MNWISSSLFLMEDTYILLDGLMCSMAGYFTSHAVFWRARRASQNTSERVKYPAILHFKPSNKLFIIQLNLLLPKRRIFWNHFIVAWHCVTQHDQQYDFWLANTHKLVKQVFWQLYVQSSHGWIFNSGFQLNLSVFL